MNNVEVHTTPFGEGLYPFLSKPDMQFNSDGIYQVKLKVKRADAEKDIKIINDVASTGIGCTLRLISCQITKLVEGSSATKGFSIVGEGQ